MAAGKQASHRSGGQRTLSRSELKQWQVGLHRNVESLGTEHLESFQASAAAKGFVGRLPALSSIL
jgi:hypothetical protein